MPCHPVRTLRLLWVYQPMRYWSSRFRLFIAVVLFSHASARRLGAFLALSCLVGFSQDCRHIAAQAASTTMVAETPPPISKPEPPALYTQHIEQEGIAVDLRIDRLMPKERQTPDFQQGDSISVRFTVSDTATKTPLGGAYPAAWMDLLPVREDTSPVQCASKIKHFASGSIFSQAEIDMTVYYVLALNADPTITVVNPRFGFGGSQLLALVKLNSPGEDWVLSADQNRLFVSMPESNQVVVVETPSWRVMANLEVGPRPGRLVLQPDGAYLWVGSNAARAGSTHSAASGVTVIRTRDLSVVARIPTGSGDHDITLSPDNRYAFVTNTDAGTVSVIDVRTLQKVTDVKTGTTPLSIAYSSLADAAYVIDPQDGTIVAIDGKRHTIRTTMSAKPGLRQIDFAPGDRLGFVMNPLEDRVYILDAALNRIIQTGAIKLGPDQVAFTDELAHIRLRDGEDVIMIPLDEVGVEGRPIPVVDFPGGQHPLGHTSRPSLANAIVQASGRSAVLVANPKDKAIYYYEEGMAAPMGNFSNYGREPRAVMVVERNLQERAPGVYEIAVQLQNPGEYDIAFLLDSPRVVHCFKFRVAPAPRSASAQPTELIQVAPMHEGETIQVGQKIRLPFTVLDTVTHTPRTDLADLQVLIFSPGVWQGREIARHEGEGVYTVHFTPPGAGYYTVHVSCASQGFKHTQVLVLTAKKSSGE